MSAPGKEYLLHDFPDRAIRRLLEDPRNLREIIADLFPDLAERFDFDHVENVRRDFLLEDWRGRESDLFFRLPFHDEGGDQPTLVCLLVEHQSRPDALMPLRILVYAVLYWEREWKEWQDDRDRSELLRLTPVIPIVFHTGERPWGTNRELAELMDWPVLLRPFAPHWPIQFWDLAERSARELLEATGAWLRALAVVRAEREGMDSFAEVDAEVLQKLESLASREQIRWHDLMEFVLSWAFQRRPKHEAEKLKKIAADSQTDRRRKKELRVMATALGQTWEEWAIEQRAEGKAEGKAEGELRAARDILRNVLEERFGKLPRAVLRKITNATDVERLKACVREAVRAKSLDDLDL